MHALARDLQEATQTPAFDMPPALRETLADAHQSTWFRLDRDTSTCTTTRRGTRPGSPLADIGFNLIMTKLIKLIQARLADDPPYQEGQGILGAWTPPVTWVDDMAVPLVTASPSDLIPLIKQTVVILHETFQQHGLSLNMDSGKTEVVLMYRGHDANRFRTELFDQTSPPVLVATTQSHVISIQVVPSYRHLGARYSMDLDVNDEVRARMSMARQTFEQMKRQIFVNRLIPINARVQLYSSLVLSRLLYGCSVWSDVPAPILHSLESLIVNHHRRMHNIGFWKDDKISDTEFCALHSVLPFRVHWARHRLVYLQHLALHGHVLQRDLLLVEFDTHRGWLREVTSDLIWLSSMSDLPFAIPQERDDWAHVFDALRDCRPWKPMIKRACDRFLVQEKLAWEVSSYHSHICRELELHDAVIEKPEISANDSPAESPLRFGCDQCDSVFPTSQQLAVHAHRKHGIHAIERHYIQSTVCPGCLFDFHSTYRVHQHLRYRQKRCWDRIYLARPPEAPVHIPMPSHLAKFKRVPAVRRHHGPIRPTSSQRLRLDVGRCIRELRAEGESEMAWWTPPLDDPVIYGAYRALSDQLCAWCDLPDPTAIDFQNMMFAALFGLNMTDAKASRIFIEWVEKFMHDALPSQLDPDIALMLETAYVNMLEDLYTWELRQKMKSLLQQWAHLPPDYPDIGPAPAPLHARPYNRLHEVDSNFSQLPAQEAHRWKWFFSERPRVLPSSKHGAFFYVHLYSGRRRSGDFHFWMSHCLEQNHPHLIGSVFVLSLDTAIDEHMNIHDPVLWHQLLAIARSGRLLGLLLGPPCGTWKSARFHQLGDPLGDPDHHRGPRPLRMACALWGLDHRTLSVLLQLDVGNCLLLKGLWLCVATALHSGSIILEHPATPFDESHPSIWRTGLMRLLLRGGFLFRKVTIGQWRYGAAGVQTDDSSALSWRPSSSLA